MSLSVTKHEFKILAISVLFGIASYIGTDIHLASLPFIAAYMHATQAQVQQSVPLYVIGMAVSMLFYGPLSDRFGRKPIIIFALCFASLFSFIGALTTHIIPFLITRVLQGIGCGACIVIGRAMAIDTIQGDRMASLGSYFGLIGGVSPLLAPALGGYIQHYFNWQMNFVFYGAFLLLVLLVVIFLMSETNKHKNPHAIKWHVLMETYFSLMKHRVFVGCMLIAGFSMAGGITYNTISSYVFQKQYFLSPVIFGWVTAVTAIGAIAGKVLAPYFIKHITGVRTLNAGLMLMVLSGSLLLYFKFTDAASVIFVVISVMVFRFAQSFIMPNTSSRALSSFHDRRGSASALYGSSQMTIAFLVASFVGGSSFEGVTMLGITYVVLGILGLFVYFILIKE